MRKRFIEFLSGSPRYDIHRSSLILLNALYFAIVDFFPSNIIKRTLVQTSFKCRNTRSNIHARASCTDGEAQASVATKYVAHERQGRTLASP